MNKVRCPICDAAMPGNWQDYPDYPFCSKRCRIIDLGRWLGEEYRVPDASQAANRPVDTDRADDWIASCASRPILRPIFR
jgi:endogenous inhibitor of DNA gyrase (YacG/DUF329 family)